MASGLFCYRRRHRPPPTATGCQGVVIRTDAEEFLSAAFIILIKVYLLFSPPLQS